MRLSSFSPSSSGSVVLFSLVLVNCHREYELPFQMFGDSPPALPEVLEGMVASGMEPHAFVNTYARALGLAM